MQLNVFLLYMLIVECRNLIVEPGPAAFYPAGFQADDFENSIVELDTIKNFSDELTYDVIVVGAGTSGSAATLTALEEGASVAVLQKETTAVAQGSANSGMLLDETNEEGYLRFESTIAYDALDQAVLTEKGFLRLSRAIPHALPQGDALPPSVRRVHATLAWQLREALAQHNSEKVARLTRQLFESALHQASDIV